MKAVVKHFKNSLNENALLHKSLLLSYLIFRYFQRNEDYRKYVFNYWHRVLASYFEQTDDMDRKAEVKKLFNVLQIQRFGVYIFV